MASQVLKELAIMLGVSAEYALTDDDAVFSALWDKHVSMLNNGKVAYYLPPGLGELLSRDGHLFRISQSLSKCVYLDVFAHRDPQGGSIRLGQVIDDDDRVEVTALIFLFKIQFNGVSCLNLFAMNMNAPPATTTEAAGNTHTTADGKKIPKPCNSWILFRNFHQDRVVAENPGIHNSLISKILANDWHCASGEVKEHFADLAKLAKKRHSELYPNYKCSPRKSSEIKKRTTAKKVTTISVTGSMPGVYTIKPAHGGRVGVSAMVPARLPAKITKRAKKITTVTVTGAMPCVEDCSQLMTDGQLRASYLAGVLDLNQLRAMAQFEAWVNSE